MAAFVLAVSTPYERPDAVPAIAPTSGWTVPQATDLLAAIDRAPSHGLSGSHYHPGRIRAAIADANPAALGKSSDTAFAALSRDLAMGRLADDPVASRFVKEVRVKALDSQGLMLSALERNEVFGALYRLAPQDTHYHALRNTLASLPAYAPGGQRAALVATLERRRWLDREDRGLHLRVNIPAYRLDLVRGQVTVRSHRVIVGKGETPTPQFSGSVEAVTINPQWTVPESIIAESVGALIRSNPGAARARGYRWHRSAAGGLSVTQIPGPQNALGRIKLEMPNSHRVYIHDTPGKDLFDEPERAFSHGCIRLEEPVALAVALLADQGWTKERIEAAISAGKNVRIALKSAVPVDVVYFTAEIADGGTATYAPDIYDLDGHLSDRLMGKLPIAQNVPAGGCG